MAIDSLRDFISEIDAIGELVRVPVPVRAQLEVAEIADRCMKSAGGGPALLFEHVILENGERSAHPVAINLFGSMRRMCLALGVATLDEVGGRISELLDLKVPDGLFGKLSLLPRLAEVAKFPPRVRSGRAPCQEQGYVMTKPNAAAAIFLLLAAVAGCGKNEPPAAKPPETTISMAPRSAPPAGQSPGGDVTPPAPTDPAGVRPTLGPATRPATQPIIPPPTSVPEGDSKVATFLGLSGPKPATWLWQPPARQFSVAEYVVPGRDGADQARIAVFQAGGSLDANITRWKSQFRGPDGEPVDPKLESLQADGMKVTIVEFAGEYRGMGGSPAPDQLFLTAVVEAELTAAHFVSAGA